ncbi:MAG: hypothetical protein ONB46_25985 [candidate division KSB1 bacterium]|nr:hypothetical protein [candidate division KSB1 bacterium]MDZ7369408.1 hypothetical protein [candidate division KSB1 bacterium]
MPTVQVTSRVEIDFEEVLNGVARLGMNELEQLADKVLALQAQRRASSLPKNETELLQKINQGLPPEVRKRYAELNAKLREETIAPEEHQELLQLVDRIELADAERLQHLIELARIRNVSVDTLMDQLEIRRPAHA